MPAPKTLRHVQVCPSNFRLTAALAGCINHCLIVDFDTVSHPLATHSAKMLRPMADGELLIETYVGDEGVAMVLPVSDTWFDSGRRYIYARRGSTCSTCTTNFSSPISNVPAPSTQTWLPYPRTPGMSMQGGTHPSTSPVLCRPASACSTVFVRLDLFFESSKVGGVCLFGSQAKIPAGKICVAAWQYATRWR